MNYNNLLEAISKQYNSILGENLVGIYIHGSIAFGCFNFDRSDIDFIAVVNEPVSNQVKLQLLKVLEALQGHAPKKGFEMSVVLRKHCKNFIYPTPYELHFSNDLREEYLNDPLPLCDISIKTDYDLAAHFTVINNAGIVLSGQPIGEVFGDVPKNAYLDSILRDIKNGAEDVVDNPMYVILSLCRVYSYVKDGLILSKENGGRWALGNLPRRWHGVIEMMLNNYVSGDEVLADRTEQIDFCEYMLGLLAES